MEARILWVPLIYLKFKNGRQGGCNVLAVYLMDINSGKEEWWGNILSPLTENPHKNLKMII